MLNLQSGKFDKSDRLFFSIKKDWNVIFINKLFKKECASKPSECERAYS